MFAHPRIAAVLGACLLLASAAGASGENVDLSTVPTRNTVQLTIYNSEDLTLVRETRAVSFKKGVNPLQFSWANTLIVGGGLAVSQFRGATGPIRVREDRGKG